MKTISAAQLSRETIATLEPPNQAVVKPSVMRDVVASLQAVVAEALDNGNAVNLFGLVKLAPKGTVAVKAKKNVPDPFNPGETKDVPAKPAGTKIGATVLKAAKEAAPSPTSKVGKELIAQAKAKTDAAAERKAEREAAGE